jgi:pyruvate, water dikinase
LILGGTIPPDLDAAIADAYKTLSKEYGTDACAVAVRSSATAEDLPKASFAGQLESYLNITTVEMLKEAYKKCLASLFTHRVIIYRQEQGFDDMSVGLSVGVQKMVRSDVAASGVAFSLDTETGFKEVVTIEASYGLGEMVVKGAVTPDSFSVHKATLKEGFLGIVRKSKGIKNKKMVCAKNGSTIIEPTTQKELQTFCITDSMAQQIARLVVIIEDHYSKMNNHWTPVDVEWAIDGTDHKLYITQARPETIFAKNNATTGCSYNQYRITSTPPSTDLILYGIGIGNKIASGNVRIVNSIKDADNLKQGEILVTQMTDPDWVSIMKRAAGIITNQGGRTCHAAIVSRELGIPAIVGTQQATTKLSDGQPVTLDCSTGVEAKVYSGIHEFVVDTIKLDDVPKLSCELMINIARPDTAFAYSQLPIAGVGLARTEFIIAESVKVHPMALAHIDRVTDAKIRTQIEELTADHGTPQEYFVAILSRNIATIAAAFYPRNVIIRFSDFKSNEYKQLLGGSFFEPTEENPMLGLRGASRYYNAIYQDAFVLECEAFAKVRKDYGFWNAHLMVPFVRTPQEAKKVTELIAAHGLTQGDHGLRYIMMCEIPSNVILLEQFAKYFDGFSIGSNDLTQLTLGIDRDSAELATLFDERNEAVKSMMELAIQKANTCHKTIGICGQAPSDFPEIAHWLMQQGISSISLNPDSVIPFLTQQK